MSNFDLSIDLEKGVVPISKAASSLAAIIKRSRANHRPVIVTQKGYPTGVILDVELYTALVRAAEGQPIEIGQAAELVVDGNDEDEEG